MAPFIFTKLMLKGEEIVLNKRGTMIRDFTYIDDIVEAIYKCAKKPATPTSKFSKVNYDPSISEAPLDFLILGMDCL